jgi:hypothetical protein
MLPYAEGVVWDDVLNDNRGDNGEKWKTNRVSYRTHKTHW